ncbi:putative hydrolase [Oceanicola granulosus HTCC2516]|uniref:Putative hydrolase n=1 Tax=Oceanicola granulosus (strain ATCC BAA-861 / DSM 15982 / KCTC 12143 / HTCC2516) TaxID=314256 RepID=Q2CB28_OCEGH|nr:alpha/beta hydrolase [Oceanicola granulosus]EAR49902.1 putative hydrolase [Oceanicola granulosus HTCC2516]
MRDAIARNNVTLAGREDGPAMVFVHGFGCDQSMWRQVVPAFADRYRIVTYDLTGMGRSDLAAYDFDRYDRLEAHADDLIGILAALELEDVILVGHSIGASIAVLAANAAPERVARLALVSPSPAFVNDDASGYVGGFTREELEGLIAFLEENHLGWSSQMAPTIMGQPEDGEEAQELTQSFCRTDPDIAAHFGRLTFLTDCRDAMARAARPSLIVHCREDALVPMAAAEWMEREIPDSTLTVLEARGHCPHMTVPGDVVAAIRDGLGRR